MFSGSGPLHRGPTDCFYTFDTAGDKTKVKGYCTFGDPDVDADRILTHSADRNLTRG